MAVEHVDIVDSERHEPKGASTASQHQVIVSDGSGSTSFALVDVDNIDATSIKNINQFKVQVVINDISTSQTIYVPVGIASTFVSASSVLGGAIATSDVAISFANAAGTSMGTAMAVEFTGSAVGDVDSFTAASNNSLAAGSYMQISTDGASTNTVPLYLELTFNYT